MRGEGKIQFIEQPLFAEMSLEELGEEKIKNLIRTLDVMINDDNNSLTVVDDKKLVLRMKYYAKDFCYSKIPAEIAKGPTLRDFDKSALLFPSMMSQIFNREGVTMTTWKRNGRYAYLENDKLWDHWYMKMHNLYINLIQMYHKVKASEKYKHLLTPEEELSSLF